MAHSIATDTIPCGLYEWRVMANVS